jgi:hypothetical protein
VPVSWNYLAERSHSLKTRPGRPHIPSETLPDKVGDRKVQWTFLRRRRPLRWRNGENVGRISPHLLPFGALAQLGEHLLCKQRVIGSIPIGSTKRCGLQVRAAREAGSVAQVVRAHA